MMAPRNRKIEHMVNSDGCWIIYSHTSSNQFGHVKIRNRNKIPDGKSMGAHRYAYIINFGPIPKGMSVCHECDNPRCINPDHLFLGSQTDNMKDCEKKKRHCHGESHGMHKINDKDASKIKKLLGNGFTSGEIASLFGYSKHIVKDIQRNKTWKHVS